MIELDGLNKLYYTIGEVADMFDVNTSLLRYWESEFGQLKPRKKKGGVRLYTKSDIAKIQDIYILLKKRGFTIHGAKKQLISGNQTPPPPIDVEIHEINAAMKKLDSALEKLRTLRNKI